MDSKQAFFNLVTNSYIWLFFMIAFGAWLFCWSAWGGAITFTTVPGNEAGLGLNPP
jgi:hypothetical protein